jgi:hypothetical protein
MNLLFWKKQSHVPHQKREQHTACPVCKGQRTIRMTASECALDRPSMSANAVRSSAYVTQSCWACQGTGKVAIETGDYKTSRFG